MTPKGSLGILFALVLPGFATVGNAQEVQYGKYVCITDRAVGLQTRPNSTDRYAGGIRLKPELQKFFATISKIQIAERCFSSETIQALENARRSEPESILSPPPYGLQYFTNSCLARSMLYVDTGELSTSYYYSPSMNIFLDKFGDRFWILNG